MIVFTLIQLTNQMRYIQITFKMTFQMTFQMTFIMTIQMKFQTSPRITFRMTFLLINFNFFSSTPKSQKSNVCCLKVLSYSQNLLHPMPFYLSNVPFLSSKSSDDWRSCQNSLASRFTLKQLSLVFL